MVFCCFCFFIFEREEEKSETEKKEKKTWQFFSVFFPTLLPPVPLSLLDLALFSLDKEVSSDEPARECAFFQKQEEKKKQ